MSKPQVFISHKHTDNKIARVIASFVERESNSSVSVHLSSDPEFQGPKFGKGLNSQLRDTLWNTEVLLLVYTSADQNWSYCMWECGVATHPKSPDTNIIVFQCGSDVPDLFHDVLRVNPRSFDDIKRFTDQFLRDEKFFRSGVAIAPDLKDDDVAQRAAAFHGKIAEVLPKDHNTTEEWPTWPYLRVELPKSETARIDQASEPSRLETTREIVKAHAVVTDSDARVAQLFGRTRLEAGMKFETLLKHWLEQNPGLPAMWFDSCCEQIMVGARRGIPMIRLTPVREVGGDSEFTPVVSRVRQIPFADVVQFDLYFFDLSDPRAVPVASQMIPMGGFFCKSLGQVDPASVKLRDLVQEFDARKVNRVPILDAVNRPLYIVHRSMVDKFIVMEMLKSPDGAKPGELTLATLLGDEEMKQMFERTFAVVPAHATLADAKTAMLAVPGCNDVFVTARGTRDEPVAGWLTNVDIARSV